MSVLHSVHKFLVANSITRRYQRRITRLIKRTVRCPDAYGDLFAVARATHPAAILDVGSYVGDTIARFLDELVIPIYGFEPTPDSFQELRKRFAGNRLVHLFNCALSDRSGTQKLLCNQNPQTNSLLENDVGNLSSFPEDTRHVGATDVEVHTLDSWTSTYLPKGKMLIKADMQGAEGWLVDGGKRTFKDRVIAFYSEVQLRPMYSDQITFGGLHEQLTNEYGFCLYNLYPCLHDEWGRATQANALWVLEDVLQSHRFSR